VIPFPEKKWKNISTAAKDLIQKMLNSDPVTRISAKEALNHPWIKL
jgi:calcium-dependent protein kinase